MKEKVRNGDIAVGVGDVTAIIELQSSLEESLVDTICNVTNFMCNVTDSGVF
jgi:hypothetical protein